MKTNAIILSIALLAFSCSSEPKDVEQTSDFMEQQTEAVVATDSILSDSTSVSVDSTLSDTTKESI
jgi:PBP1b-binding outer membrane lipoprotein LpoB